MEYLLEAVVLGTIKVFEFTTNVVKKAADKVADVYKGINDKKENAKQDKQFSEDKDAGEKITNSMQSKTIQDTSIGLVDEKSNEVETIQPTKETAKYPNGKIVTDFKVNGERFATTVESFNGIDSISSPPRGKPYAISFHMKAINEQTKDSTPPPQFTVLFNREGKAIGTKPEIKKENHIEVNGKQFENPFSEKGLKNLQDDISLNNKNRVYTPSEKVIDKPKEHLKEAASIEPKKDPKAQNMVRNFAEYHSKHSRVSDIVAPPPSPTQDRSSSKGTGRGQ